MWLDAGNQSELKRSQCNETSCKNLSFILTTRWVTNKSDEYSQKLKTVADILRSHYDEGLLCTLLDRNKYRGTIEFPDFCYLSGDLCAVKELPDGRYNVYVPRCMIALLNDTYVEFCKSYSTGEVKDGVGLVLSDEIGYTEALNTYGIVSHYSKAKCPYKDLKVINIEGKELPEDTYKEHDAVSMYLRELE